MVHSAESPDGLLQEFTRFREFALEAVVGFEDEAGDTVRNIPTVNKCPFP